MKMQFLKFLILLLVTQFCTVFTLKKTQPQNYQTSMFPLDLTSLLGLIAIGFIMLLATLAGIGGSAAFFPINLIFYRFSPRSAIAHTAIFALAGCIARFGYELASGYRNPANLRINYHIALTAASPLFLGSFLGVMFNKLVPNVLLLVLVSLVLCFLIYQSVTKYFKKRKQELQREKLSKGNYKKVDFVEEEVENLGEGVEKDQGLIDSENELITQKLDLTQYMVDILDILIFLALFISNPIFSLLRGSQNKKSIIGVEKCSIKGFSLFFLYIVYLTFFGFIVTKKVLKSNKKNKNKNSTDFLKENSRNYNFTKKGIMKLQIFGFLIGLIGSFAGSGIAAMLTLGLTSFGLDPFVASPTTLLLTIMITFSSSLLYWLSGLICWKTAVTNIALILFVAILARATLYTWFLKKGKASYLMLFIALIMCSALPSNIWKILPGVIEKIKDGQGVFEFGSFC